MDSKFKILNFVQTLKYKIGILIFKRSKDTLGGGGVQGQGKGHRFNGYSTKAVDALKLYSQ